MQLNIFYISPSRHYSMKRDQILYFKMLTNFDKSLKLQNIIYFVIRYLIIYL